MLFVVVLCCESDTLYLGSEVLLQVCSSVKNMSDDLKWDEQGSSSYVN